MIRSLNRSLLLAQTRNGGSAPALSTTLTTKRSSVVERSLQSSTTSYRTNQTPSANGPHLRTLLERRPQIASAAAFSSTPSSFKAGHHRSTFLYGPPQFMRLNNVITFSSRSIREGPSATRFLHHHHQQLPHRFHITAGTQSSNQLVDVRRHLSLSACLNWADSPRRPPPLPSTTSTGQHAQQTPAESTEGSADLGSSSSKNKSDAVETQSDNNSAASETAQDSSLILDDDPNKSLFQRFKDNFKKYWYVMLPVHFVTSWAYLGAFYYLASIGFSPVPLLEYWGVPDEYLKPVKDSSLGLLAVALAFYKLATPLRYVTTLGVSGVTVRVLSRKGLLPSSTQVKKMVKDKVDDIKQQQQQQNKLK